MNAIDMDKGTVVVVVVVADAAIIDAVIGRLGLFSYGRCSTVSKCRSTTVKVAYSSGSIVLTNQVVQQDTE